MKGERKEEENESMVRTRRGWKNHLFFPLVYRSSSSFLICFFASSRCDTSLNVSEPTTPLRPSSSSA